MALCDFILIKMTDFTASTRYWIWFCLMLVAIVARPNRPTRHHSVPCTRTRKGITRNSWYTALSTTYLLGYHSFMIVENTNHKEHFLMLCRYIFLSGFFSTFFFKFSLKYKDDMTWHNYEIIIQVPCQYESILWAKEWNREGDYQVTGDMQ